MIDRDLKPRVCTPFDCPPPPPFRQNPLQYLVLRERVQLLRAVSVDRDPKKKREVIKKVNTPNNGVEYIGPPLYSRARPRLYLGGEQPIK